MIMSAPKMNNFAPHPITDIILGIYGTINRFYSACKIAEDFFNFM